MKEHVSFKRNADDMGVKPIEDGYMESITIPDEAFDDIEPQPGDKYTFNIQGEVESVSKDGVRVKVIGGCCVESYDEDEFEEADPEKQDKMVEKEFDKQKNKDKLEEYAGKEE